MGEGGAQVSLAPVLHNVDEWGHMLCVFEEHVQELLRVCGERAID